jgi:hypothetical protein
MKHRQPCQDTENSNMSEDEKDATRITVTFSNAQAGKTLKRLAESGKT